MSEILHDGDGDVGALTGQRVAVVGYGNQGRSWALNLRDSGVDVTVCVRADDTRDAAVADGFAATEVEAAGGADVICLLVPDDVIAGLPISPRDDSLVVVASGYTLAFGRLEPPGDAGMVAPRMLGPEVRRCYEEGVGFITAVGVHRDVTGTGRARTLGVAKAIGGLRQGALELTAMQEAVLDLGVEQALSPALRRVNESFIGVMLEEGIPIEAILTELFLSGEVERTYRLVRLEGGAAQMLHHSPTSQYGQLSRVGRFDHLDVGATMRELVEDITSGRFADEWDAERDSGYARLEELRGRALAPEILAFEEDLRLKLGEPPRREPAVMPAPAGARPAPVAAVEGAPVEYRRVRAGVIGSVIGANFAAAALLFVFNNVLAPDPDDDIGVSLLQFVVVSVVAFSLSALVGVRLFRPVERWLSEGRPPTEREADLVVQAPRRIARATLGLWLLTTVAVAIGVAVERDPAIEIVREGAPLLASGFTCAALSYLLVERFGKPLVTQVLGGQALGRPAAVGLRSRLLLAWALGSALPLFVIAMGEFSFNDDDPRISAGAAMFLAGIGIVAGGVMTWVAARSVADPIGEVRRALASVRRGELSVTVPVNDTGEIGLLQAGVNDMVAGLEERQRLADLFGRHVGAEVARRALEGGVRLTGERRQASALFVDLRNSTGMAARSAPEDVVVTINRFFTEVVRAVGGEDGWVNKFEGDGALCVFGAPARQDDHAARALRAGRVLRDALARQGLDAGIGISAGDVVAGNVGTEERYEYTVIGDPVNEAARLTEAAKTRPERLLASRAAVEAAGDETRHWVRVASLQLRGRDAVTEIFAPADGSPRAGSGPDMTAGETSWRHTSES